MRRGFYALVDGQGVYRSSDHGLHWSAVGALPSGVSFPSRTYSLSVSADRILAGTKDGVWSVTTAR